MGIRIPARCLRKKCVSSITCLDEGVVFWGRGYPTLQIGGAVLHIFIHKKGRDACKRLPVFRKVPPFGHLFPEIGGFQEFLQTTRRP